MGTNLPKNVMERATCLIRDGWGQGQFVSSNGVTNLYCPVGAIESVLHDVYGANPRVSIERSATLAACKTAFHDAIFTLTGETPISVINWNDNVNRTQAEVVAVMEKAQELL